MTGTGEETDFGDKLADVRTVSIKPKQFGFDRRAAIFEASSNSTFGIYDSKYEIHQWTRQSAPCKFLNT